MKIALVHEWFAAYAGSERVVEEMLRLYPEADLHALVDFLPAEQRQMLAGKPVRTSFIQRLPFARRWFRGYLPLMPLAVEQFDLSSYDVVLSSHHAVAKGVLTRADQLHVSYVHTPMRYAWDLQHDYLRESRLTWGVRSVFARAVLHYLRLCDVASAARVDAYAANSRYVARRIAKTWRREAEVIYPPVDVERYAFCEDKDDYYLTAGRLVPYKRVDLIVEAFNRLPDKRLVVIGEGPLLARLRARAGRHIEFRGYQDSAALCQAMQRARAFVFAADEDFGIVPVEAQACGTPVIAYGKGGVTESVLPGETGQFFERQTPESLAEAIVRFEAVRERFEPEFIRKHAERFSAERFRREFAEFVERQAERFFRHGPDSLVGSPPADALAGEAPGVSFY